MCQKLVDRLWKLLTCCVANTAAYAHLCSTESTQWIRRTFAVWEITVGKSRVLKSLSRNGSNIGSQVPVVVRACVCCLEDVLLENARSLRIDASLISSVSTASQLQPVGQSQQLWSCHYTHTADVCCCDSSFKSLLHGMCSTVWKPLSVASALLVIIVSWAVMQFWNDKMKEKHQLEMNISLEIRKVLTSAPND